MKTVPEDRIVETLVGEALRLAEELKEAGAPSGPAAVDVR